MNISVKEMLKRNFLRTSWCKLRTRYVHKNVLPEVNSKESEIAKIRNIGILAHIDAGKYYISYQMQWEKKKKK
jgi:hypothetical protein